jgi:hypothetical protein
LRVPACLGAWLALKDLRGDLSGFAREVFGLDCPSCIIIAFYKALPALPFGKIYKNVHISDKTSNLKETKVYMSG